MARGGIAGSWGRRSVGFWSSKNSKRGTLPAEKTAAYANSNGMAALLGNAVSREGELRGSLSGGPWQCGLSNAKDRARRKGADFARKREEALSLSTTHPTGT